MEFIYSQNINSQTPVMLINQHIGWCDDEGQGVDGAQFQRELIALDAMNKERIDIQINTPGGVLTDGYNMFSAIFLARTLTRTINVGLAASTGAWLFLAGKERVMMDYAITYVHNPFNVDENSDNKGLVAFKDSIVSMISGRTGIEKDKVSTLMNQDTFMDSSTCLETGFATSIKTTTETPVLSRTKNAFKEAFNYVNSLNKPIIKMDFSKICNKLGIMENSNEDSILKALDQVLSKSATELTETKNQLSTKADELVQVKNKLADFEKEVTTKLEVQNKALATAMVSKYANKVDASSIDSWENKALLDYEGTEELLKSIPLYKKGPGLTGDGKPGDGKVNIPTNAMGMMAELNAKLGKK